MTSYNLKPNTLPSLAAKSTKEKRKKVLEAVRARRKINYQRFKENTTTSRQRYGIISSTIMKYISSTPQILSGMPVITGTRVPVARILSLLKEGYLLEE